MPSLDIPKYVPVPDNCHLPRFTYRDSIYINKDITYIETLTNIGWLVAVSEQPGATSSTVQVLYILQSRNCKKTRSDLFH